MKRVLTAEERGFFAELFARYDRAKLPHAQARNADGFPETMGNDIDLLIPRAREGEARAIFLTVLREHQGELWQEHRRDYFLDLRFTLPGSTLPMHLDLYWGVFTWHGLPYVDEATALGASHSVTLGASVRPAHAAMGMIFGSLLWGGFYKARYLPKVYELLAVPEERVEFARCIHEAFGELPHGRVTEPPELSSEIAKAMRLRLKKNAFGRDAVGASRALGRHWLAELRTVFQPPGFSIAVLGPDGSGKSTVLAALAEQLGPLFVSTHRFHWRPSLLPDVGVLLGKRGAQSGPVSDPHARPPHSTLASLGRLFWYAADYWLGHLLRIRRARAQAGLVLFDRHAADMWCDPRRYRFGLPREFIRALTWLLPRTELTFVLLPDAAALIARKNEIPEASLADLLAQYRTLAESGPTVFGIDATQPVDQVVESIMETVRGHLKARLAR